MENESRIPTHELSSQDFRNFFISHLNRIYCAKSRLTEKLPELQKRSCFLDLRQAINETVEIVESQIARMKEIYIRMDAFYTPDLTGMLDEAFQSIGNQTDSAALRDLSVLFYMQNIESIEITSFNMLIRVADQLHEKEVSQLLLECYDEAREDKVLFREITAKYL